MLDIMSAERAQWEGLLAQVGEARMAEPGVAGDWSVKDMFTLSQTLLLLPPAAG